jgi:hypothetical protein
MSDPGGRRSSMATNIIGRAALGMILAAGYSVAASAGGIAFTWDLLAAYPGLPRPFTAVQGTLALHADGPVSVYDSGTFALHLRA